jgi:oxygen-independent coproporphyrinogen-3 oxidase
MAAPKSAPLSMLDDRSAPARGGGPAPAFAAFPAALGGTAESVDAAYFHIPFCSTKCHYCDFYSLAGHLDQADAYLRALDREMALQGSRLGTSPPPRPRTIFVGGGTPTLLAAADLERFLAVVRRHLDLSRLAEFTVEANPNTFTEDKAAVLAAGGVNRISFGAQSFVPAELRTLQRDHDPASVARAFAVARGAGIENLSLDLIFGIPGQTVETWEFSLARGLDLGPSHVSCYSLTYEPNTAMTARLHKGEFTQLDEETELAMFDHVYARLREAGFVRYETSNYARRGDGGAPDRVCQHNLIYWKAGNWVAFGPSAGAHLAPSPRAGGQGDGPAAWQWKNVGSLAHYLAALAPANGPPRLPITQLEALRHQEWVAGAAVFWLRLAAGLGYDEFRGRTGYDPEPVLRRALAKYIDLGLAECSPTAARILDAGVPVSNRMLADVLAAFEAAPPVGPRGLSRESR